MWVLLNPFSLRKLSILVFWAKGCLSIVLSDLENTLLPKIAQITITHKALPLVKTMASSKKNPQQDHYLEWRFWFVHYPWSLFCNTQSEDSDLRILLSYLAVTLDLGNLFSFSFLPFDSTIVDCSDIIIIYFFVFVCVIWSCGYIGLRWFWSLILGGMGFWWSMWFM